MLLAPVASASPSARLVYSRTADASSCPGEGELRSAVAARLGYDPFFSWAKQTVVIQILRLRGRYVARLQLLDEQGVAHGTRELTSNQKSCSEIFEASALAIGIALDAAAAANPPPAEEPPPTVSPPPAPSVALPPPPPTPSPAGASPPAAAPPPRAPLGWGLAVDALGAVGTLPAPAPGVAVGVFGSLAQWSLALELRYDASESASRAAAFGGGRVQASLYSAQVVPCWTLAPLAICAIAAAGVLEAQGADIDPRSTGATLFAAAGARLGATVALPAHWSLRVHTDGVINLHRATLALGPDAPVEVWTAPAVAGTLGIGVARKFP
jgi:hypothetical protein